MEPRPSGHRPSGPATVSWLPVTHQPAVTAGVLRSRRIAPPDGPARGAVRCWGPRAVAARAGPGGHAWPSP